MDKAELRCWSVPILQPGKPQRHSGEGILEGNPKSSMKQHAKVGLGSHLHVVAHSKRET